MDRKPTNCAFFFIFIIFCFSLLGLSIYGFAKGDFKKLMAPQNAQGEMCGFDAQEGFPYLYFFKPTDP